MNKVETKDQDSKIIVVPLGREFSTANAKIASEQKSDKEYYQGQRESFHNEKVVS